MCGINCCGLRGTLAALVISKRWTHELRQGVSQIWESVYPPTLSSVRWSWTPLPEEQWRDYLAEERALKSLWGNLEPGGGRTRTTRSEEIFASLLTLRAPVSFCLPRPWRSIPDFLKSEKRGSDCDMGKGIDWNSLMMKRLNIYVRFFDTQALG